MKLFLEPRSIALIGVPRRTGDGANVLENLLAYGYPGQLYPVNPAASEILGMRCYASIQELPMGIDLAFIFTPRSRAVEDVKQCAAKGITALIVVAQGFADTGEGGRAMQEEMVRLARKGGCRILGPNTFGVGNAFLNLNTAFVPLPLNRIPIATIAQSGMLFAGTARRPLMGKAVDLGNACDIDFADALEYFGADPQVKVICLHMEDVKRGRRFMEVARRVARRKPIIALKGGRTEAGARIARSHTGSLAGRAEIYEAAFRQSGVIGVADFDELDDLVLSFWYLPLPRGKRVAILTLPMGAGVLTVDACRRAGLDIAELSPATRDRIAPFLPPWMVIGNPVDLGPAAFVQPDAQRTFREVGEALLSDPGTDALLFINPAPARRDSPFPHDQAQVAQELARNHRDKPVLGWIYAADQGDATAAQYMEGQNLVVYPTVERAARALSRLVWYARFLGS